MKWFSIFGAYCLFHRFTRQALIWILLLVGATIACGLIGYHDQACSLSISTRLFRIANMLAMNTDDIQVDVANGWLEAARWLGFVVWLSTVAAVIAKLFQQILIQFLVGGRWCRGHIIVAGLGRDGDQLVKNLCQLGHKVVVLDTDVEQPSAEACRTAGAIVLKGDPTRADDLKRASLIRADHVLALFGDDRQNIQTAVIAYELLYPENKVKNQSDTKRQSTRTRPTQLHCTLQVAESRLLDVLGDYPLMRNQTDVFELTVLNRHELAARAMWREATRSVATDLLRRILVVGGGSSWRIGECLVLRAAKDWYIEHDGNLSNELLEVRLCERDAKHWCEHLPRRIPRLNEIVKVEAFECWPEHDTSDDFATVDAACPAFDAVFVCIENEELAFAQARRLRQRFSLKVPIVVPIRQRGMGLDALLRTGLTSLPNFHTVGTVDRIVDPFTVLTSADEEIAQTLHQEYLAKTRKSIATFIKEGDRSKADAFAAKPAFTAWSNLTPDKQDSNRELAKRLHRMLEKAEGKSLSLQYASLELINPTLHWNLSPQEIEQMAKEEHEDWMKHHLDRGWKQGTHRNDAAKIHPDLVKWESLSEEMRENDRNIIRRLPYVFAKADFRLVVINP